MLDRRVPAVYPARRLILIRRAEQLRPGRLDRTTGSRGNTAIGSTAVGQVLESKGQRGCGTEIDADCWIDTVPLQEIVIAESARILTHRGDAQRCVRTDRDAQLRGGPFVAETSELHGGFGRRASHRSGRDDVDDATG